jgi:hypothetical protein
MFFRVCFDDLFLIVYYYCTSVVSDVSILLSFQYVIEVYENSRVVHEVSIVLAQYDYKS